MSEDEGFLARWSRRKRTVAEPPEPAPVPAVDAPAPEAGEAVLPPDELELLPRIEDITAETDITGFMRPGVPASLRNQALRQAWLLDPLVRDGVGDALDYAWDYNKVGGAPGYGPIEASMDVAGMVARMLSRTADDPAQADEPSPGRPEEVEAAAVPAECTDEPEVAELPAPAALPDDEGRGEPEPAQVRPVEESSPRLSRRRHGGAMPL